MGQTEGGSPPHQGAFPFACLPAEQQSFNVAPETATLEKQKNPVCISEQLSMKDEGAGFSHWG